ncbi:hypothetical protein SAMN06265222_12041 [Neorhodopirellula lusitana]|uniref:Uncharacterized protein n=1 Tax=Neorhodopirellula lusitana TaxID=445327 RepID=A0ABY1QQJ2_9BACT|nr:hypothetical protein SAMN06265222_12041 [Neorhodopirellula lusitana]
MSIQQTIDPNGSAKRGIPPNSLPRVPFYVKILLPNIATSLVNCGYDSTSSFRFDT